MKEAIVNTIVSRNQTMMTLMGVTFKVPIPPKNLNSDKKRTEFAEKEADKIIKILKS